MELQELLTYLTPFVVFIATAIVKWAKPLIPGWMTLMVVTVFSALLTFVNDLLSTPDETWLIRFLLGMGAIVLSQFVIQFGTQRRAADKVGK